MQSHCKNQKISTKIFSNSSSTPALVLVIATIIFSLGYKAYKHVPPTKNNLLLLFIKVVVVSILLNFSSLKFIFSLRLEIEILMFL